MGARGRGGGGRGGAGRSGSPRPSPAVPLAAPLRAKETPMTATDIQKLMTLKTAADEAEAKRVRYEKELVAAERRVREQTLRAKKAADELAEALAKATGQVKKA